MRFWRVLKMDAIAQNKKFKNVKIYYNRGHLAGSADLKGVPNWGTPPESCPFVRPSVVPFFCRIFRAGNWREAPPPQSERGSGIAPPKPSKIRLRRKPAPRVHFSKEIIWRDARGFCAEILRAFFVCTFAWDASKVALPHEHFKIIKLQEIYKCISQNVMNALRVISSLEKYAYYCCILYMED